MKKLVKVEEVEGEGLLGLLGQNVTLYCQCYIYAGKLEGVNSEFVLLTSAEIVYDTGSFDSKKWSTSEKYPNNLYVMKQSIESFSVIR